ncbi:zf-HC2 domain-containing protein [Streptomyces antnestii]|uniref:Zf-HC2 domain-containing protein n=1 Tax=Streptomyces antnestii TaxID=2494256 RepID=A0A437P500_9ACTN|nr:zf-HC2 domain-containing protein [Streptomyces sp. San01]RVU17361.1 zf-HC2 domain-containing protein [Streptomyces sp. San01]
MSGSRPDPAGRHLSEHHLGDRLAALVDGELGHDARERGLAHLATCPKCKAEADAQRRLKSVFADSAPPPPTESFLARLQGLPGGGDDRDGGGTPFGGGGLGGRGFGNGVFGVDPEPFGYAPSRAHEAMLPSAPAAERGFRIHEVGRGDSDRSASRGRRFAFAAAGAVSLAAIALGGVSTGVPADTGGDGRGAGSGSNATPLRSQSTGVATSAEAQRRRNVSPMLGRRTGTPLNAPVAAMGSGAPLLSGAATEPGAQSAVYPLATPLLRGTATLSPLIRPAASVPALPLPGANTTFGPGAGSPGSSVAAAPATPQSGAPRASAR